jgi:hypothetical protein
MSKHFTMREAIAELAPNGASVALGLQIEQMVPFAAGHEISPKDLAKSQQLKAEATNEYGLRNQRR